jgi:DNA-binding GntR family transcriptional regulator
MQKKSTITNTRSIRQRIYDHPHDQLLNGEIPPCQHLIETKIAKEIGTSRTPIMEALHSLELEGLGATC